MKGISYFPIQLVALNSRCVSDCKEMANVLLLKDVEEFLKKDLRMEKLSSRIMSRKNALLEKVSNAIKVAIEQEKMGKYLNMLTLNIEELNG